MPSSSQSGFFSLDRIVPSELSRQLRTEDGGFLSKRRGIVNCALGAAGAMGLVSLYQMGVISHIPEPPLPGFNADEVDASEEAYQWFSTPDGPIGLASYAGTTVLAAVGGRNRAQRLPLLPLVLAVKTGADAAMAGRLTRDQWTKHQAFCFWCLVAAGCSVGAAALAIPEAREALRVLRSQSSDA